MPKKTRHWIELIWKSVVYLMLNDIVHSLRIEQKLKTPSEIFPSLTADHSFSKNMSLFWSEDGIKIERYYFFESWLWENDCDGPKLAKLTKNLGDQIFLKNDSIESWRAHTALKWERNIYEVLFTNTFSIG